jgi:hypothetical protein
MTTQEAKEILALYRPGISDPEDPAFAEALRRCEEDSELREWFENYTATNDILRQRFKEISVPEGFHQQILAERPLTKPLWNTSPLSRRVAAGIVAAAAVTFLVVTQWNFSSTDTGFSTYKTYMVGEALRSYGMEFVSENPEQIRHFLKNRNAISDYTLPEGLRNARMVGCVAKTWQGRPVSMICFRSGKPLPPGQSSDVWLFVTEARSVPGAPASKPIFEKLSITTAASWTQGGKNYLLAVDGNLEMLKKFL